MEGDPRVRGAFSGEIDETLSGRGAAASEDAGRSLRHPEERSSSCSGSCVCGAAAAAADSAGELGLPGKTPFDRFFLGEEGMKQNECTFSLKSSFKGVKGQRSDLEKIDGGS